MSEKSGLLSFMPIFFIICMLAMIWPGIHFANKIYPMILGLPFLFFWEVMWIIIVTIGLFITFNLEYGGDK